MTGDPTSIASPDRPTFNPLEPGFAANPYPQYRLLVDQNPVQQSVFGPWMLFRYDDCVRFLRDPTLSVEDTSVEGVNPRAELREKVLGDRAQRGTRSILNLDPPDHTRIAGSSRRSSPREPSNGSLPRAGAGRRRTTRWSHAATTWR